MPEQVRLDALDSSGAALPMKSDPLRLIEENVRDYAIFMVGIDCRISSWNQGVERILGYTEAEYVGMPLLAIFTQEDQQNGRFEIELDTARTTGRAEDERWHIKKDGSRFWANGILTALRDEQGSLCGYVKILQDFTWRKKQEDELHRHQTQIEQLNTRLRLAMTETHHRVKNNLQVIAALVDLKLMHAEELVPSSELRRIGDHIRSLAAIHDLLTDRSRADLVSDDIPVRIALDKLLPLLAKMPGAHEMKWEIDDIVLPVNVCTAVTLITNELIANAFKHGKGLVALKLEQRADLILLEVSDEGPGFPPDFDPRLAANTGLELVQCLTDFDLHGEAKYETNPAGGATVHVTFPLKNDSLMLSTPLGS